MKIDDTSSARQVLTAPPAPAGSSGGDDTDALVAKVLEMCKEQIDAAAKMMAQSPDSSAEPASTPLPPMPQIEAPAPAPQADDPDAQLKQGQLSDTQKDAIMTLSRHEGEFSHHGNSIDDLASKANDSNTPPDLRKALHTVLNDPGLLHLMEDGDKNRISRGDIRDIASRPDVKAYSEQKAADYARNYIPSGDEGKQTAGRPITKQDAEQELYKYADYLPKKMSEHEFDLIVSGESNIKKRPPQLIAAAYYFKQHPDEWKELNGGSDKVRTGKMEDNISAKGELTQNERAAIDQVTNDPNHVFGDSITRQSLQKVVDDPKASKADKDAARTFLDDAVLFGKADNAEDGRDIHGLKKLWHKSDDGKITRGDLEAFRRKLQDTKVYTLPSSSAKAPTTAAAAAADTDMLAGEVDQPEMKKAKGGALKNVVEKGLTLYSKVEHIASQALSAISLVMPPVLKQAFDAAAAGAEVASGVAKAGADAVDGGNWKKDLADTAIFVGGKLVDAATDTDAGTEATTVAKAVVDAKMAGGSTKDALRSLSPV
jgi:type III secretion translocon protein HrpF